MGNIQVNHSLDPDRRILHYMSFYDLIELLKFNQAFFTPVERPQRQSILKAAEKWHRPATKGAITLQSWSIPAEENLADWGEHASTQPRVCIVSSIRALAQSLFTDDTTSIFIEPARHPGAVRKTASGAPPAARRPAARPDGLCAIAVSHAVPTCSSIKPSGMHLLVDLKTLLAGVIVPPDASVRFMDLVSKLVQESAWVSVTRASRMRQARAGGFSTGP
ncbi:MAG: hypothetical protein ACTS5Y_05800 [Pollutimonas bauzanensis]